MAKVLRIILWVLVLGYWGSIAFLTHVPRLPGASASVNDKLAHIIGYAGLAGGVYLLLWVSFPGLKRLHLIVLAIVLVYGALDEWTQPIFHRDCDFRDWLADAAGAILAVTVMRLVRLTVERLRSSDVAAQLTPGNGPAD